MILIAQSENAFYLIEIRPLVFGDCFVELDGQVCKQHSVTTAAHRYALVLEVYYPAALMTL